MGPCITGEVDIGDAIAFRNGSHDVDIFGARVQSGLGASIHIWPGGANSFHFLNNVLGENHGSTSYHALQIDPATAPTVNPTGYDIEGNDLVGASPLPFPLPTPSFFNNGLPPAMRNNRGALGLIVKQTSSFALAFTLRNPGPFDCTYYFTAWTGTYTSSTISLPGATSAATLPTTTPSSIYLPVGSVFQANVSTGGSGTTTYVAFCQP
jgi:hypothetical protein